METPIPLCFSDAFKSIELILKFMLDQQLVTLRISHIATSWMISYDPAELKTLFYDVVSIFTTTWLGRWQGQRRGTLRITFKAQEQRIAVQITMSDVLVTSLQWERFFNQIQDCACYEHLRELGGSIEPLTWDEGQGQGVIVRLPWPNP